MIQKRSLSLFVLLSIFLMGPNAFAGEQGHYYPGVISLRDVVQPPKGFYFTAYDLYYSARDFKDRNGNNLDSASFTVAGTKGLNFRGLDLNVAFTGAANVDIDLEVDLVGHQLFFAWISGIKMFGADYGAIIAPYFGYARVKARAEVDAAGTLSLGPLSRPVAANASIEIKDSKYGFGDTMVAPVWLQWHKENYDLGFIYGVYAPTGAYDEGDLANIGMGFWTHSAQIQSAYYLNDVGATAFVFSAGYEWNSKKYDKDVRPGQVVTLEYGISQYLHERFAIGLSGYSQFQISEDTGAQASNENVKDRIHGLGGEIQFWPVKNKMVISARTTWEYGGVDRFQGILASLNLTWIFGDAMDKKLKEQWAHKGDGNYFGIF